VDVESMQLVASTLTLIVAAFTLVTLAAALSGRGAQLIALVAESRATLTMLISLGATLGSLYFSEIAGYVPCRLCWFQRIAMYPLAVIGAVWMIRGGREGRAYALPIAAVGALISTYHYLIEWNPSLDSGACAATGPACSDVWFRSFGFVTLALMALVAFAAIITVNLVGTRSRD